MRMMLHFVFLARVVVGGLECDGPYGSGTVFYVQDKKVKCWVGDMNAAFNEGEELMSEKEFPTSTNSLDLTELSSGIYFIQIKKNQEIFTKKIIKN